ncbi:MAG: tetratricopeptide repeat protein [Rhodospirillales bacterium]
MNDDLHPHEQPSLPARPMPGPWPHAVQSQVNRILVQPHFVEHEEQAALLRCLVEEALANPQAEFSIDALSRQIFNETGGENEQRLENAYRSLRETLIAYYRDKGRNDPVLFTLSETAVGIAITANDVRLDQDEIDADAERSAVLPKDRPINIYAMIAVFVMVLAVSVYFFGLDDLTTGPTGPESITDVGPSGQRLHSIAVMPFETDPGNPAGGFFAAGIAGELTARLGRITGLRLIAPETMRRVGIHERSPEKIAKDVDSRYLLQGKLARERNTLILDLELLEAKNGDSVWRRRYERNLEAAPALYADIGNAVAAELARRGGATATPPPPPSSAPKREPTDDAIMVHPGAYTTYLKARTAIAENRHGTLAQSITLMHASINRDASLPRAHSGLAAGIVALAGYGFERIAPHAGMTTAKKAVVDALRLNEYYPEPYAYLGVIRTVDEWDWEGAERAYAYAIRFNPSYADARLLYSRFLEALGRRRDAIDQAERAHVLNPASPETHANRAWQYLQAGWLKRAREHFTAVRKAHPRSWLGPWGLGHYHWRRGDLDEAIESVEEAVEAGTDNTLTLATLGHLYGLANRKQKALDVLRRIQMIGETRYVSPVHIAAVHAGLGNHDQVFDMLDKALAGRAYGLAWINATKEFDSLHATPRYRAVLERMKLTPPERRP